MKIKSFIFILVVGSALGALLIMADIKSMESLPRHGVSLVHLEDHDYVTAKTNFGVAIVHHAGCGGTHEGD